MFHLSEKGISISAQEGCFLDYFIYKPECFGFNARTTGGPRVAKLFEVTFEARFDEKPSLTSASSANSAIADDMPYVDAIILPPIV